MKAKHKKGPQGLSFLHTNWHELYSCCRKQQITTCWVTLKDTVVQFLGILLNIYTVPKNLYSQIFSSIFFFIWKEQQFPFFHASHSFFHLEKDQHLDFPQLESSKSCLVQALNPMFKRDELNHCFSVFHFRKLL